MSNVVKTPRDYNNDLKNHCVSKGLSSILSNKTNMPKTARSLNKEGVSKKHCNNNDGGAIAENSKMKLDKNKISQTSQQYITSNKSASKRSIIDFNKYSIETCYKRQKSTKVIEGKKRYPPTNQINFPNNTISHANNISTNLYNTYKPEGYNDSNRIVIN